MSFINLSLNAQPPSQPRGPAVLLATFNRPNDTAPYAIGDVISASTGSADTIIFTNPGMVGKVWTASLVYAHTIGADFDLLLFDGNPSGFADNAALALSSPNDEAKLVGSFRFPSANKINIGSNLELYRTVGPLGEMHTGPFSFGAGPVGGLFGLVRVNTVFTPAANTRMTIRLHVERD
ncbi:MAG TPA: hypothetical protein VNM34_14820 [Verrucomicrobiae bacterium]|nr:hypothetical protein [Verrucomicrobiae bacterium]